MNKINVLHIIQNSKIGGIQIQLLNLMRAYDRERINPTVCCLSYQDEVGRLIEQREISFVTLNVKRHYRFSPRLIVALYKLMKDRKIHVVRAHKYSASLSGRIAAWLAGVPVIITSVHDNYNKDRRFERRIANIILARITDRIVAVSESIKEDVIRYDYMNPSKVMVILNGVDTSLFSPAVTAVNFRTDMGIKSDDIVIGSVGRLVPAKGLQHLIEAFALIRKERDHVKLLIVGYGELLDSLKKMAVDKNLGDDILFAGKRTDIPNVLASIDIFVMSSIAEGLPNALLEAMAMAKPIVVTEAGGMPEVIKDGVNGFVVKVGDAASLAKALQRLMDDRETAAGMARAAREFIEKNFSIKATARTWETLYMTLLREKGQQVPPREAL